MSARYGAPPTSDETLHEALSPLDRRAFLRLCGATVAWGLVPVGCGPVPTHLVPPDDLVLTVLSPRAYATFQAAALRLLGPSAAALVEAGRVDPAASTDAWLARVPALAPALSQGLTLLEFGVWPIVAKLRPFSQLGGAEQDAVLSDLVRSRIDLKRDLFRGLRSLAMLVFYAHPVGAATAGYPGPFDAPGIRSAMTWSDG